MENAKEKNNSKKTIVKIIGLVGIIASGVTGTYFYSQFKEEDAHSKFHLEGESKQEERKSLQEDIDSGNLSKEIFRVRKISLEQTLKNVRIPGKPDKFGEVFYVDNRGDLIETRTNYPLEKIIFKGFDINGLSNKYQGFDTLYETKEGYSIGHSITHKHSSSAYEHIHFLLDKNGKVLWDSAQGDQILIIKSKLFNSEKKEIDVSKYELWNHLPYPLEKRNDGHYAKRNNNQK